MKERPLFHDSPGRISLGICILVVAVLWHCGAVNALGVAPARRVAILSSKEIRQSGLTDLLTVQVQELSGIKLVERDLLKSIIFNIDFLLKNKVS